MSTLRDDFEVEAADSAAAVQKAYDEALRYEFMGKRLEPWTVRRHSVALQLRTRLVRGTNDEHHCLSNFLASGFYPHVYHDLVIVLFLLHLAKLEVVKLERMPEENALGLAYDWAESVPLTYGSAPFFEGVRILGKILHSIQISWYQVRQEAGETSDQSNGEKKTDTEPPGKSNSVSVPSKLADIVLPMS